MVEWRRWYQTSAEAFGRETERLAGMLLNEGMSEGVREQIERTRRARQRWEERLIAYNAYREWSSGHAE